MPCAHLDLLSHIYLGRLLLIRWLTILSDDLLTLIGPVVAHVLASLVHELHVNLAVGLILDVYHVHVPVVAARQNHGGVWTYLEVKLVEYIFALVNFTQLLLEVLSHVEHLARLPLVPDVPDLHTEVVA